MQTAEIVQVLTKRVDLLLKTGPETGNTWRCQDKCIELLQTQGNNIAKALAGNTAAPSAGERQDGDGDAEEDDLDEATKRAAQDLFGADEED